MEGLQKKSKEELIKLVEETVGENCEIMLELNELRCKYAELRWHESFLLDKIKENNITLDYV